MTNTNDFRRYSYSADFETTSAVNAFNQTRSSAAPKFVPEPPMPKRRKGLSISTNERMERLKSREELVASQRLALRQVITIVAVLSLAAAMLFSMLFTYAKKNEYTREIANLKTELSREVNQNICTNSELEALVTIDQIEDYAVNKLGMVKLQSDQIRYIDVEKYKEERFVSLRDQSPGAVADSIG